MTKPESPAETPNHGPSGRRAAPKPTRAEFELRINEIHKLLINQVSRKDIIRYIAEKTTWNLQERTIDRYIQIVTKTIRQAAIVDRELELGLAIQQTKDLYAKTARIQDYRTSLQCRRELSELIGLYAPKRVALTNPEGGPTQYIALIPGQAKDNAEWSEQCRKEQAELERQRQASGSPAVGPS